MGFRLPALEFLPPAVDSRIEAAEKKKHESEEGSVHARIGIT
jgi:hypothetical protein